MKDQGWEGMKDEGMKDQGWEGRKEGVRTHCLQLTLVARKVG